MTSRFLGQTLMQLGQQIPQSVRSNRKAALGESELLRRNKMDDEQFGWNREEAERNRVEQERADEAQRVVDETLRLMQTPQQEPVLPEMPSSPPPLGQSLKTRTGPLGTGSGLLKPELSVGGDTSQLTDKYLPKQDMVPYEAPLGPKEASVTAGLPKFGDVPVAKEFNKAFIPSADQQSKMSERKWTQQVRENTPEKIKAANYLVDALVERGDLDTTEAGILKQSNLTNSDASVETMRQRFTGTAAQKKLFNDLYDAKVSLAGEKAAASTEGSVLTKRDIQKENPVLSDAQSGSLSDSYNAIDYLNMLKSKVDSGDADYFDIHRKTGQFTNPEAADAFLQMVEIVGRKRSGAAISPGEWKNFGKQILNKNNLLTDRGRETALKSIDRYLDKFYGAGVTTTGNEDWYTNYRTKAKSARSKGEATRGDSQSGSTDEKRRRLEELRRKKAAGTLGR